MRRDDFTGSLFKGQIGAPTARYLVGAARAAWAGGARLFVNPCCGLFGLPLVAAKAGFPASQMLTCDIGLVSAILGCAITGRPLSDLQLRFLDPLLQPAAAMMGTDLEAGAALAAIKVCQYKTDKLYTRQLVEDICGNWQRVASELQAQVQARVSVLRGLTFELCDMWEQIDAAADDPEALICLFPPAYKRGYDRMFPIETRIEWAPPDVAQFDPTSQQRLFETLRNARAFCLWSYYGEPTSEIADLAVFSEWAPNREAGQWWLSNRPEKTPKAAHTRRLTQLAPADYPLWPRSRDLTPETEIRFVETSKKHALYYRDLFAHKLGVTRSERYFFVLLDGHIMSVFGLFFDQVNRGHSEDVNETFGFTVPNDVHGRLSRLFMLLLVSGGACEFFNLCLGNPLRRVSALQTTCISPWPEVKTDRGILKLRHRERMPDGRFKLDYYTPFNSKSFAEVLAGWLAKDGKIRPRRFRGETGESDGAGSAGGDEPADLEGASRGSAGAGHQRPSDGARNVGAPGRDGAQGAAA